jgi:CHAT domain-containing protein/Tfp pilus assembly protein PilF
MFPRAGKLRWILWGAAVLTLLAPLHDSRTAHAEVEYNHSRQLFLSGQLEKSQAEAERGYDKFKGRNDLWASRFRLLEAEAMVWRGMYQNGLVALSPKPSVLISREDKIEWLTLEGVAYTHLQQFALAVEKLKEAEKLCASASGDACGSVLRARGIFAVERGDFAEAHRYFLESLSSARAHKDQLLESTAYLNLGVVSLQESHYDEALDWSKSANISSRILGNENRAQITLGNMGWAYFKLGDSERALQLFVEAEQQAARLGNIRYQVKWLTTAGDVYWDKRDFARASESFDRALALAKRIDSKEDLVNTLEDLTHASIDAGKLEEANAYLRQLEPLLRANGNRLDALYVTLAQARIAAASHYERDAESLFREVEKDPASQTSMRLGSEHELARLYESEGNTADANRMYRTSLETFEAARADLKKEESKLPFLANATGVYDDYIHFLVAHHKTGDALVLADRSRARTLEQGLGVTSNVGSYANVPLRPGEISRKLDSTLLFYWLGERESYLWAITPAKTSMFTLPARSRIEPMIERYRKALLGLSDPIERSNGDGVALYQTLIAPARELIRPGSTVMILDDGVLSQLNFETLIASEPARHYFIEDATLISAPSLQMLASAKPVVQSGKKLLLVGDAISPNPDYPELPKAATEMKQIEQHFPAQDETVFAREGATAGAYLASTPQQFAYIHFVAHGVASRTDPLDSAIILSRSTAEEDAFKLHARDIIKHPIHARLVTISACYGSGTRSYVGEGLVGLAWAFMRAGAHNVIGGLWEVSDESTPRLMSSLYQGLQGGKSPGAALRDAKLELLHAKGEFRKPFFWAPLQIYTGL